jgi:hypothetical protein
MSDEAVEGYLRWYWKVMRWIMVGGCLLLGVAVVFGVLAWLGSSLMLLRIFHGR